MKQSLHKSELQHIGTRLYYCLRTNETRRRVGGADARKIRLRPPEERRLGCAPVPRPAARATHVPAAAPHCAPASTPVLADNVHQPIVTCVRLRLVKFTFLEKIRQYLYRNNTGIDRPRALALRINKRKRPTRRPLSTRPKHRPPPAPAPRRARRSGVAGSAGRKFFTHK
ncbi:hypothetical protein EVAR_74499_1 [Eumeta japonica]|uniref:Uncharacterized protein n=1 Tax=Eumeta variegata TaxID=151549 RepID=A0A4C1TBH1_EUMVA|nr:hypothetical protein EVAR_74499_1 [Eumeta japonica]